MSGHRRYRRRRSSESSSSGSRSTTRSSMRASTTETDDGGHRRLKRSSASLPVPRSPASRHPSWVLLSRAGARRDSFPGDRTTSAMSRTSRGDEISVSFEFLEPPGTSVLTIDYPQASSRKLSGNVIAAHRDVVLLAITSDDKNTSPPDDSVVDLFVYQVSRDPSRHRLPVPSLLLLPSASAGGPEIYPHIMDPEDEDMGISIMSCTNKDDDSASFVVAHLEMSPPATNHARLFRRSGTGQWESFQNLHVHGANGDHRDLLRWWTTDAVVRYGRRRYLIWVDYYRGMLLMDRLSETNPPSPPRLQYVPLPVNRVEDPEHIDFGYRGCPKDSRSVRVTRYGIKFVSIDSQHWSDFGLGNHHVLTWSHRFRITTWSLREHDYSWRRDATMHEQEFWDVLHGRDHRFRFRHVQPEFPVIDVENPDVVVFRLEKQGHSHRDNTKWMIKINLRKKVRLAATAYSKKESDDLSGDEGFDPIPTELPRYFDGGQQACKKRRQ